MPQVLELPLGDGGVLLVEATDDDVVLDRAGRGSAVVHEASETLRDALDRLRPAMTTILNGIREQAEPPDRVSLQFGIKVSAAAGVVVAQAASEANFTVTVEWGARTWPSP